MYVVPLGSLGSQNSLYLQATHLSQQETGYALSTPQKRILM
jgi:hypothetical protein